MDADNGITAYTRSMNYLCNLGHLWIKSFCFVDKQEYFLAIFKLGLEG
jgi:hypothetical protein